METAVKITRKRLKFGWINTNKNPKLPFLELKKPRIKYHKKEGIVQLDLSKAELYISEKQKTAAGASFSEVYEEVKDTNVWSASFLQYLLKYPKLIPETWKGKEIFFWGTIYQDDLNSELAVMFLYFNTTSGINRWEAHAVPFIYRLKEKHVAVRTAA